MPLMPFCLMCGRALSDPASIRDGFGPECAAKIKTQQAILDHGKRAVASGFSDDKLRVMALVLKRRESALLLVGEDQEATELQIELIRAIRREMAARVELLIRRGYLSPIESDELAATGLPARADLRTAWAA